MNTEQVNELIQSLESAGELSIKETKVMALAKAYQQLAAENVALKAAIDATIGWQQSTDVENVESVRMLLDINTPATDRIVAGIKAEGAEACVRVLVTSDDDDFADAPNICAEVARLLREGADK
ncbi:hypothetical protein [Klebsiella oxytoca]|uniref:hypothetical protein n=1 Tax=Klebsiella oxytoca TaxID=571 RepID=UPI002247518C|nr:hypothetical protein [Klebsiella oxytoca]MCW9532166.1 hypothetical protein [Klebsiella oxytoca]HEH1527039.1 hypothetical protein [Klebsiella oxytoca]